MKTEILYKYAVTENNELVHIDKAEKGIKYFCPECEKEFLLKKSGKIGKGSKQPHFAHKEVSPNCTAEGYLHKTFKKLVIRLYKKVKSEKEHFLMQWTCTTCNYSNLVSLFQNAASIREEYNLKVCRPDIALLDEDEKIFAALEIVVRHAPEENVLQYFKENNIALIQINVNNEEELSRFAEKIQIPDIVDYCLNPNCPNYSRYNIKRQFLWKKIPCNARLHPIVACKVVIDCAFGRHENYDFSDEEIQWMKQNGTNVKFQNTNNIKIATFSCNHCAVQHDRYMRSLRGRRSRRF